MIGMDTVQPANPESPETPTTMSLAENGEGLPFRRWEDVVEERYGHLGEPKREAFEHHRRVWAERHDRINRRAERLTGWMYRLPPRWVHLSDQFGHIEYWGLGPLLCQFWYDFAFAIADGLEERQRPDLGQAFYAAADGLAWRFLDDMYVPTLAELADGSAREQVRRARHGLEHAVESVLAQLSQTSKPNQVE